MDSRPPGLRRLLLCDESSVTIGPNPELPLIRIYPERRHAIPGGEIVRRVNLSTCAHCGGVIVQAVRAGRGLAWQHLETAERACADNGE